MSMNAKWEAGNLVFYEPPYRMRWLYAMGPTAITFNSGLTPSTGLWTATAVGASTFVGNNGGYLLTTAGADNDGISAQVSNGGFSFAANKKTYFGCKVTLSEATQIDMLVGLCVADTALLGGVADGAYFECLDGGTGISVVTEVGAAETQTDSMGTMDTSAHIYELFGDNSNIDFYIDGALVTSHTAGITAVTDLCVSIEVLTGDNSAETATIDWVRAVQVG